jgi:hypothetical protein
LNEAADKSGPKINIDLSPEECETILKALGSYQILLYDKMIIESSSKRESDIITGAIKKIHRKIEDKNTVNSKKTD